MFNFTISTDNVAEAQIIIYAINRVMGTVVEEDVKDSPVITSTATTSTTDDSVTTSKIQDAVVRLVRMTSEGLVDKFGARNDKPYRVIRNVGLSNIIRELGIDRDNYEVDASYDDVINAIQIIVKDVSEGGLSHNDMEDLFGVRTSKDLFDEYTLDGIVNKLKENSFI